MSDPLQEHEQEYTPHSYHPIADGDDDDIINRRTIDQLSFSELEEYVNTVRARREHFIQRIKRNASGDGIARSTKQMAALQTRANKLVKKIDAELDKLTDTITKMRALYIQLGDTPPHEPA